MIENSRSRFRSSIFIALLIGTIGLNGQMANAGRLVDQSFSAINSFEDRRNAFVITGIDKSSGQASTLVLYRFHGRFFDGRNSTFINGTEGLLTDARAHRRCYDYTMRMLDEPNKFFMTFHLELRDDPSDFSRNNFDQVLGCDIERQVRTLPAS